MGGSAVFGLQQFLSGKKPTAPKLRRAAQYVRMSTEHQRYSIENQKLAIAEYALCHEMEVVRTYADEGRSGVTLKGRDALKLLLSDVKEGRADFEVILVYDVSRWGRFQDADESAFYEFICKAAGLPVVYCAEIFENNGSMLATIIKVMKRAMAGEYSRELSVRVTQGHKRQAEQGFHQGGPPNFGLRRILVDKNNQPKMTLRTGESKTLYGDRVLLAPGPQHEIRVVREIFRFVVEGMAHKQIARHLNSKRLLTARGNPWSNYNISKILQNEKYAGTFVYSRSRWPLQGGRIPNPPDRWIRVEGAIKPIVERETYDAAQRCIKDGWTYTDNEMLTYLTAAWCVIGYLSAPRINKSKYTPTAVTYRERFGSLYTAYQLIGYRKVHAYRFSKCSGTIRIIHRNLICRLTSTTPENKYAVTFDESGQVLRIGGVLSVAVIVLAFIPQYNTVLPGWKLYFDRLEKCDAVLMARMTTQNTEIIDYHLLPRDAFSMASVRFTETSIEKIRQYKLPSIDGFSATIGRDYADIIKTRTSVSAAP